jgi:hypothetical protein
VDSSIDDTTREGHYKKILQQAMAKSCKVISKRNNQTSRLNKRFICTYKGCKKVFPKQSNMMDHLLSHLQMHLFHCRFCGRGFNQRGNCTRHEKN